MGLMNRAHNDETSDLGELDVEGISLPGEETDEEEVKDDETADVDEEE